MDAAIDLSDASKALDLDNIRFQLIRLEDTITFHLIERVQFPLNKRIYIPGGVNIPNSDLSLMDWMLRETERIQSRVRRYQSPDEYPFFHEALETPILQPLQYPHILHKNDVNVNDMIKSRYINEILPHACGKFGGREDRGEAQENYGSAATCDVSCLQALSRRIHFGKFVAESKFRKEPERFVKLIKAADKKGIEDAITNIQVEKKVLERLRLKAATYGRDPANPDDSNSKIDVEAVVAMYKHAVIPMTKIVEVEYLMQRLQGTKWETN
ncbi:chorismate mutase aro7 [Coccidioides posadasii str. Silveira]|uniref:Chorismate mutase n=3 Tax=Coccidioides posadasii TaxID=199306 RepID=E9DIN9_COCPS|nr:chorismate mutase, putative [Coccidioides posadasii C735 delta SOWgp]EER26978.1 chorismate mutase, putative [Coccidioides posadasii C735 delta SOWgp]EFW13643.1 chorismate mutase [Coccidioides posadasii str. Silveira]KMM66628.1 chorismate mutase [Coccidioides posadasii RMSCC 3488]QVM07904.1 chorismate mutase aro7 [Coccidioides posadasii str. Silveira]|eukprot:XP_003069123.1 chorismate mutase, putative [Coccidioides posadasii C735 delta SOWgp]